MRSTGVDDSERALDDLGYFDVDGEHISYEQLNHALSIDLVVLLDSVHGDEFGLACVRLLLDLLLELLELLLILTLLLVLECLDVALRALLYSAQQVVLAVECLLDHAVHLVLSLQKLLQICFHSFFSS